MSMDMNKCYESSFNVQPLYMRNPDDGYDFLEPPKPVTKILMSTDIKLYIIFTYIHGPNQYETKVTSKTLIQDIPITYNINSDNENEAVQSHIEAIWKVIQCQSS